MNGRDGALRVYADFVFELVPKTKADRAFVFAATSAADQERCGSFFFGRGWGWGGERGEGDTVFSGEAKWCWLTCNGTRLRGMDATGRWIHALNRQIARTTAEVINAGVSTAAVPGQQAPQVVALDTVCIGLPPYTGTSSGTLRIRVCFMSMDAGSHGPAS